VNEVGFKPGVKERGVIDVQSASYSQQARAKNVFLSEIWMRNNKKEQLLSQAPFSRRS